MIGALDYIGLVILIVVAGILAGTIGVTLILIASLGELITQHYRLAIRIREHKRQARNARRA